jgi:hypothetical protein
MAMRLRPFFSPEASRVRMALPPLAAAAFAVASRRCSGRMTMPLPSTEATSSV